MSAGTGKWPLQLGAFSGTAEYSLIAGIVTGTNNPRVQFTHTESTSATAVDFATSAAAGPVDFRQAGANVISLSANRNVTIAAPSSGNTLAVDQVAGSTGLVQATSLSGSQANWTLSNPANTASSAARIAISVGGASAADPFMLFDVSGVTGWSVGVDNSDSDTFKLDPTGALTTTTNRFNVTTDGRIYGNALHNNAGAVTGTTNQFLCSGTFTPTLTGVANVAASTSGVCGWIRLGNMVSVWGAISVDPTSATTLTRIGISLPIASNLAGADLWGVCSVDQGLTTAVNLSSDTTNDRAELYYVTAADVANRGVNFNFGYIIQ
jgi:hypothetical protein